MAQSGRIPSNQIRGYRRVTSVPLTADNQQFTVDLPRGAAIESACVTIDGSINVTVAGTAVRQAAPVQLISRVDWVLNGNITLASLSGMSIYMANAWIRRVNPSNAAALAVGIVPPVSAGVGAKTIHAPLFLDRILVDMFRPKDSVLKTDENVTTNQLRITTGTLASILTGAATITYTALTLTVWVQDYQEQPANDGRTPVPLWYPKFSESVITFAATGDQAPIRINTGNRLRGVMLRQEVGGEGTDNQLNNIRLIRSGDTRIDLSAIVATDLRMQNLGPNFAQTNATGIIPIDLANPGTDGARYSEFWPLPSNADAQLLLNVGTVHTLRIMTLEGVDLQR